MNPWYTGITYNRCPHCGCDTYHQELVTYWDGSLPDSKWHRKFSCGFEWCIDHLVGDCEKVARSKAKLREDLLKSQIEQERLRSEAVWERRIRATPWCAAGFIVFVLCIFVIAKHLGV